MRRELWILAALACAAGGGGVLAMDVFMEKDKKMLTVALQGDIDEGPLAPENISTIPLFHLHFNLWDTLITERKDAAIADSFTVSRDGKVYSFSLSPSAAFSNGRPIQAADIKSSIERLMARGENGHINAKTTIKAITANGEGRIDIELFEPTPSFLFLLATPEFGIVPREALDEKGNVVNLQVTSGAYVLSELDFPRQTALLRKNSYFRRFGTDAPEEVHLSFLKAGDLLSFKALLSSKAFDFIELQNSDADSFIPEIEKAGYRHAVTLPSMSIFLLANSKRVNSATAEFFASHFQKHFRFGTEKGAERPSRQLFPPKTFGSLAASEIPTIPATEASKLPEEVRIKAIRKTGALYDEVKRVFGLAVAKVRFLDWNSSEDYDYRLSGQGMNTEYPEIELHLKVLSPYATFDVSDQIKNLVRSATHSFNDETRSQIIKDIGADLLRTGKIVPLTLRSYVHVTNPDRVDASQVFGFDGNIPLYELREIK